MAILVKIQEITNWKGMREQETPSLSIGDLRLFTAKAGVVGEIVSFSEGICDENSSDVEIVSYTAIVVYAE